MLHATLSLPPGTVAQMPQPSMAGQTSAPPASTVTHGVIQRHLLMALHCHEEATRLQQQGDAEGALRQQRLMGVFLHNALDHLP